MVNKCVAFGCNSGYKSSSKSDGTISSFHFPLDKPELLQDWIRFVNRCDWKPTTNSVLCELHFDDKFISRGKRSKLLWKLNPIPTLHSNNVLERPSTLPIPTPKRKPPTLRTYQNDELNLFKKMIL